MKGFKFGVLVGVLGTIFGMMLGPWIVLGTVALWICWPIVVGLLKGGVSVGRSIAKRRAERDPFGGDFAWERARWHS